MRIPTYAQHQQQAALMAVEYDKLSTLLQQADSGKTIMHSSEDPVLASQIKTKHTFLDTLQSYHDNGVIASNRATLVNSSMTNILNLSGQAQVLIRKAANGTLSDTDRAGIAKELQAQLAGLVNSANTRDANGGYIFSGSNTISPAYVQENGVFQYQGSMDTTSVNITPNVSTVFNESGYRVFGDIYQGNGTFTIATGSSNVGAAFASPGNIVNATAYVPDNYTLTFVQNSSGQMAYQVTGATAGQVIPPPPAVTPTDAPAYKAGDDITFNGMTINVSGVPHVGDTLTIAPSTKENIFNTIQNTIHLLDTPVTNVGAFNQSITQIGASFAQILNHLTTYQSEAGTRSAAIDTQIEMSKVEVTNQISTLSDLEDVDIPTVYSALTQQSMVLQATQAAYLKMQEVLSKILQMQF